MIRLLKSVPFALAGAFVGNRLVLGHWLAALLMTTALVGWFAVDWFTIDWRSSRRYVREQDRAARRGAR